MIDDDFRAVAGPDRDRACGDDYECQQVQGAEAALGKEVKYKFALVLRANAQPPSANISLATDPRLG